MKSYLRFLSRNKMYTAIEAVGLSVALAFVLLIGSYVLDHKNISRKVADYRNTYVPGMYGGSTVAYGLTDVLKEQMPEIEKIAYAVSFDEIVVSGDDMNHLLNCLAVRYDFFEMFGYEFIQGSASDMQGKEDIFISERMAAKLGVAPADAMGMRISVVETDLNSAETFTVKGVVRDSDDRIWKQVDFFCHAECGLNESGWTYPFSNASSMIFFEVPDDLAKEEVTVKAISIIKDALTPHFPNQPQYKERVNVKRIDEVYFSDENEGDLSFKTCRKSVVNILSVVVLLLLLSSVINYINLNLALTGKRAKEMATRMLVGSEKYRIVFSYIRESVLFTAVCFIIALALAWAVAPVAGTFLEGGVRMTVTWRGVLICTSVIMAAGCICGIIPAFATSSIMPIDIVNGTWRRRRKMVFSKIFIGLQGVLAVVLVAISVVMEMQMKHMMEMPVGADITDKIMINTCVTYSHEAMPLRDEIRKLPFVKNVSFARGYPTRKSFNSGFRVDETGETVQVDLLFCDPEAFRMWNFEIKEQFSDDLSHSFWISDNLYRLLGSREKAEELMNKWNGGLNQAKVDHLGGVIGNVISENAISGSIEKSNTAVFVMSEADMGIYNSDLLIETEGIDRKEALSEILKLYDRFSLDYYGVVIPQWDGKYIEDLIADDYTEIRNTMKMIVIFTLLAILISALGLIAMSTHFAVEREKDIAVRKVYGGTVASETGRSMLEYMLITVAACVVGIPVAWSLSVRYLEQFTYRIDLTAWPFVAAALIALMISLSSVLWQTLRAARTNPAEALKKE